MIFSHGGDYGDVVYSLMAVKYLCKAAKRKCCFYLWPGPRTRVVMTAAWAEGILPLLRAQPYIEHAAWRATPLGLCIDHAQRRFKQRGLNMADQYSRYLVLPYSPDHGAWLKAKPNHVADVVIARSQRYNNPSFPWAAIYQRYKDHAVFVGTPDEHAAFELNVGQLPHYATPTLLDAMNVIAGAKLFVGNQSAPRAIAEGLKVPICVEQAVWPKDTYFERKYAWYDTPPPEGFPKVT